MTGNRAQLCVAHGLIMHVWWFCESVGFFLLVGIVSGYRLLDFPFAAVSVLIEGVEADFNRRGNTIVKRIGHGGRLGAAAP